MFIHLTDDEPAIVGPDARTGMAALVIGDAVFVTDSAAAARRLLEGASRWNDALARTAGPGMPPDPGDVCTPAESALAELMDSLNRCPGVLEAIYNPVSHGGLSAEQNRLRYALEDAARELGVE